MKIKFFDRLNVRVNLFPIAFIFLILISVIAGLHIYVYKILIPKLLSPHIVNACLNAKEKIDGHISVLVKDISELSKSMVVINAVQSLQTEPDYTKLHPKKRASALKMAEFARSETTKTLTQILTNKAQYFSYKSITIFSPQGKILADNSDNADKISIDNFSEIKDLKISLHLDNKSAIIVFTTAIYDKDKKTIGYIKALSDADLLSKMLHISYSQYPSEKLELIDNNGNLYLTPHGLASAGLRYNINGTNRLPGELYERSNIIFSMYPLKTLPFHIIYTVSAKEASSELVWIFYSFIALVSILILVLIIQVFVNFPKYVTKPIKALIISVKTTSISDNTQIVIPKGIRGELTALANAINKMIEQHSNAQQRVAHATNEINLVNDKTQTVDVPSEDVTIEKTVTGGNSVLVQDFIASLQQKANKILKKDSVTIVFDYPNELAEIPLKLDTNALMDALDIIINHSVSDMQEGVVSVLVSSQGKKGIQIKVLDTVGHYDDEAVVKFNTDVDYTGLADITQAKKIMQSLGGNLTLDCIKGKNTTYICNIYEIS